jgi:hypothetical protein
MIEVPMIKQLAIDICRTLHITFRGPSNVLLSDAVSSIFATHSASREPHGNVLLAAFALNASKNISLMSPSSPKWTRMFPLKWEDGGERGGEASGRSRCAR